MFYELIDEKRHRHLWKYLTEQRKRERVIVWVKRLIWQNRRSGHGMDQCERRYAKRRR